MDITVTEIMELADMQADSDFTADTPADQLPRNLLERKIQEIFSHIAGLEAQVWQCGAGAGCCAQAARIAELEAQLEAVGADPDDEAVPANAAESYTQRVIEALYENGDPVSADAAEELQRLAAQLEAVGAGGVGPLLGAAVQQVTAPDGWQLVPAEPTKEMKAAAVKFANGNAVYKNVSAGVLEIEEGIYGEAYEAMLAAAPQPAAQAVPVEAQHSTACLYHYALSRLGLRDNTGLRVLFWDAHNSLSWDSKTDWYVTPDADKADCGLCDAARAAQGCAA